MGRPTVIPCEAINAQRPPIDVEKEAEPWKPYYNPDDVELANKPFLDRPSHICTIFERICTVTEILGSIIVSLYNPILYLTNVDTPRSPSLRILVRHIDLM
jgi:hypothetical protein